MSKPFSIADIKFYPINECVEAKNKLKGYNYECMSIIHEDRIGSMNFLLDKFNPVSEEDFFNKWIDYTLYDDSEKPSERGRSVDELYNLVLEYQSKCDRDIPAIIYFKDILMHAIYQTWNGRKRENEVRTILGNLGYETKHSEHKEDSRLNIDLFVYKDNELKFTIQIKPISTFMNNANWALATRKKFFRMEEKAFKKYGVPHSYLIYNTHYDTDMKWIHNDNKDRFLFSLDEICDKDGKLLSNVDLTKNKESETIYI